MAHHFMFDPDPANPVPPAANEHADSEKLFPLEAVPGEFDLVELAEKFAAHGGGQVSPQVSVDLALDLVLNQIAEQACLATPASGAAIVLARDGEWVCRASAGDNSPNLGARLDAAVGLSGACIKMRQAQRCDDALSDPRADAEASRNLGVRSIMILPLLQGDELAGLFEVFSPNPSVFGERDQRTLEALSRLVLTSLQRASEPSATVPAMVEASIEKNVSAVSLAASTLSGDNAQPSSSNLYDSDEIVPPSTENGSTRGINLLTWILGTAVLVGALFLAAVARERLVGRRFAARGPAPSASSAPVSRRSNQNPPAGRTSREAAASSTSTNQAKTTESSRPTPSELSSAVPAAAAAHSRGSPPPGMLMVYQNGKEIFRLPPTVETSGAANQVDPNRTQTAREKGTERQSRPVIKPAAIYEMSPEEAESNLLRRVEPDYPEQARQQQIQGTVLLDVQAGRDGSIQEVKLLSGEPLLADAAIAAVKQWRFRPRKINGLPVEMQTKVTLNFKLPH
jgi:TonB family protein